MYLLRYVIFVAAMALTAAAFAQAPNQTAAKRVTVSPPTPRPPLTEPKRGIWPFTPWSYAKGYTFNFFPDTPDAQPVIIVNKVWSPYIRSEHLLTARQAAEVVRLVNSTKGTYETSKCPFPRHAVVFFDAQDEPVASTDVCFTCEDMFAWPNFPITSEKKYKDKRLRKAFDAALVNFRSLFGKELGEPVNWRDDPQPAPPKTR